MDQSPFVTNLNHGLPQSPARFSIIHQGAIGDFLLACPVFEGIHGAFPDSILDFWAREDLAGLLASKPYFGRAWSPDSGGLTPFYHDELWRTADLPTSLAESGLVLVFGQAGARLLALRLSRRMPKPVGWIQSFPQPDVPVPVTKFVRQQVSNVLRPVETANHPICPFHDDLTAARALLSSILGTSDRKPICIHPGSGGMRKVWPLNRWWGVLEFLRKDLDKPVALTLGPADEGLTEFAAEARKLGVGVVEGLPLGVVAALISLAELFVGSDSGISHLAAAVGTPVVVIFGFSDPRIWSPVGPGVHVFEDQWEEGEIHRWSPDSSDWGRRDEILDMVRKKLSTGKARTIP